MNIKAFSYVLKNAPITLPIHLYKIDKFDEDESEDYKLFLEKVNNGREIDNFYSKITYKEHKSYLMYPMIAYQRDDYSDILHKKVSYEKKMLDSLNVAIKSFKHKLTG